MKIYNTLILSILGSALIVGTGSAQSWTVNATAQPTSLTTSASEAAVAIDPVTGATALKTAGAGPAVTISANPTSVDVGAPTSITWNTSGFGGNFTCARTSSTTLGGWSGSSPLASGSISVTMPSTAQTVTVTLSCTGDNGIVANSTTVAVNSTGTTVNCSQRPPNYNGTARTLVNGSFSDAWGLAFPGGVGQGPAFVGASTFITHGTVLALRFVAPPTSVVPFDGYLAAVYSPEGGGRGSIVAGLSECPGEINNVTPNCHGSAGKTQSDWTLRTPATATFCSLVPGRVYYYNMSVSNSGCVSGPGTGTPGAQCAFRLESKQYF